MNVAGLVNPLPQAASQPDLLSDAQLCLGTPSVDRLPQIGDFFSWIVQSYETCEQPSETSWFDATPQFDTTQLGNEGFDPDSSAKEPVQAHLTTDSFRFPVQLPSYPPDSTISIPAAVWVSGDVLAQAQIGAPASWTPIRGESVPAGSTATRADAVAAQVLSTADVILPGASEHSQKIASDVPIIDGQLLRDNRTTGRKPSVLSFAVSVEMKTVTPLTIGATATPSAETIALFETLPATAAIEAAFTARLAGDGQNTVPTAEGADAGAITSHPAPSTVELAERPVNGEGEAPGPMARQPATPVSARAGEQGAGEARDNPPKADPAEKTKRVEASAESSLASLESTAGAGHRGSLVPVALRADATAKTEPAEAREVPPNRISASLPDNGIPRVRSTRVHEIQLQAGSQNEPNLSLRVVDREGRIHLAVHARTTELAASLREDLGSLVSRMNANGLRAETWSPGAERLIERNSSTDHSSAAFQDLPDGSGTRHGDQQDQRQRQPSNPLPWMDFLESESSGESRWEEGIVQWLHKLRQ